MKKKLITAVVLLLIIVIAVMHHKRYKSSLTQMTMPVVQVRIEKPLIKSIPLTVSATASLVADKSITITPRASGYIKAIYFHEGQTVKAGQTLFQLGNQTQQEALTAAQANFALSQVQYQRDKRFLKKGFITQDMYYSAKAAFEENEAALETAQINLSDRSITAPFDGTVGAINTSLGGYVNPGAALTTLVDNKHCRVEYALPVSTLPQLTLNQTVTISDPANKKQILATVSYISPSVDQSTQTIAVHAKLNNTANIFKPGEYVNITQNLGAKNNALLVPEQSVLASINGYSVFVVRNNKAIRAPVKIGAHINGNVIIMSGLNPMDDVIVAGQNDVKNNEPVTVNSHQS